MSLGTWVPTLSTASIHSSLANPAQVSDSIRGQIVFNYQPYFAGINRGTAAAAIAFVVVAAAVAAARDYAFG